MWGSWFGITLGGLLVVLLFIAIAFGTSALLFPVLIAAFIAIVMGGLYVIRAVGQRPIDQSVQPDPVSDAAPASSEQPEG